MMSMVDLNEECEKCSEKGRDLFECRKDGLLKWFICVDCMIKHIRNSVEDAEYWENMYYGL